MDDRISIVEYANMKNVSRISVFNWIKGEKLGPLGDAVVKVGRKYMINPMKADQYLETNSRITNQRLFDDDHILSAHEADAATPSDHQPAKTIQGDTYRQATTWKIKYEALLRKQEYEIKSGKYILADEARSAYFNKARSFRDAVLNIPPRIGKILAAEIYDAVLAELTSIDVDIPETLLPRVHELLSSRTEHIMKSEIEQALKELAS